MQAHFVPQLLLKNFAVSGKPGKIYVYRRNDEISNPLSIRKVAARKNFYTLRSERVGLDKRRIEKSFSLHETGAAPIIKHFLTSDRASLVDNDREVLSFFIAGLAVRNPWFRNKLHNTMKAAYNEHIRFVVSEEGIFKDHCLKVGIEATNPEELERMRRELQQLQEHATLKPADIETVDYLKLWPFAVIEELAESISAKSRTILESEGSSVFVVSDNPIVLAPPKDHLAGQAFGFAEGSVLLPISPRRLLYLRNYGPENRVVPINREQVEFLNEETMRSAHIEVYSNVQSQGIKTAFDKTLKRDQ